MKNRVILSVTVKEDNNARMLGHLCLKINALKPLLRFDSKDIEICVLMIALHLEKW